MQIGSRVGAYEVVAKLGEGGMGEVYRARDTKLERDVALKILPEAFARDTDRVMRFEREARTLAALNHPSIAQIHGFEQSATAAALVMELVDGEDLAERIARGPVPLDEALHIAQQMAEALEAAHDAGIVHRDLKPANVKVRADGAVKVLDFGLAKAIWNAPAKAGASTGAISSGGVEAGVSHAVTSPAVTMQGMILGTAAYMSPEQAKGRAVDRRADIWAFGCVVFEMLAGERPFSGDDVSETIVAIFRDAPDWSRLPSETPAAVRSLLERCLEKDPRKRLPHIGVARLELAGVPAMAAPAQSPDAPASITQRLLGPAIGLAAGLVLATAAILSWRSAPGAPASQRAPVRFQLSLPEGITFAGAAPRMAISPDGRTIVYQVVVAGKSSQLWLRHLGATDAVPISGTDTDASGNDLQQPFWSPDGRQIAFFSESAGALRKLTLESGSVETIAKISGNQFTGDWNAEGTIVMSSTGSKGIQRVSAAGGTVAQVTRVDSSRGETSHLWPDFAPDGKHVVYLATTGEGAEASGLYVASLDGGDPKRLLDSTYGAQFAPPDGLLYVRDDALVAQRFDLDRLELVGEPVLVVNDILRTPAGRVAVSPSAANTLVYARGEQSSLAVAWVDRRGDPSSKEPMVPITTGGMRLSPDGRSLVFARAKEGGLGVQVWMRELTRGVETLLPAGFAFFASSYEFSPDGSRLAIGSMQAGGGTAIHEMQLTGSQPSSPLAATAQWRSASPRSWSPDGRYLLFEGNRDGRPGLWLVPMQPGGEPVPYVTGEATGRFGADISPDGRWVAYAAGAARSQSQIFVQSFPDPSGGRQAVSAVGGAFPRWSRNGRELFFVSAGRLYSVPFSGKPRAEIGPVTPLFDVAPNTPAYPYDVSPDNDRFLVARRTQPASQRELIVWLDWLAALGK